MSSSFKLKKKSITTLVTLVFGLFMYFGFINNPADAPNIEPNTYYVTKVVDGDTLDVSYNNEKIKLRLIGINTPETVDPRKPVECFGKEASNYAKKLLTEQTINLEFDPSQDKLDKYGRTLAYVYLPDGTSFNKRMIEEGYAYEYTYEKPYKYQAEFKQAQKYAEQNKRGLWADGACAQ